MTLRVNFEERIIRAALISILFLAAGIYSCFAQRQPLTPKTSVVENVKNTGKTIRLVEGVNQQATAYALHETVNSPFAELKPSLTPCGNRLYFSRSLHPNNTGGVLDFEDIWYSEYSKTAGTWSDPIRLPGQLNNAGPNFVNSVSMTGDTIILGNQYSRKGKMRAGLSYSVIEKGEWSLPIAIDIKNDYNISDHANAYVSLKSGIIISAIQRCETYGNRDLYVSFWDGLKATEPVNMGGVVNSDMEESSPYLAADNKTLYFASKGHHGYGGYDIYVTRRLDDSWTNWSEPENLGPAVNGSMDDEFFSITHCGKFAIFSRQMNVHNTDLYKISLDDLMGHSSPADVEYENQVNAATTVASL